MFIGFDPLYLILVAPTMLLALWAQARVKSAYAHAQRYRASSGMTGAEAARRILQANGLTNVEVEQTRGFLGDHYDPRHKVLRLSPDVYNTPSLAAVGIAAHEAGHALQDAKGYAPLALRNMIVPVASVGSNGAIIIFIIGMLMNGMRMAFGQWLMIAGVVLFAAVVVFQLINLPVEFDASRRARQVLVSSGIIASAEDGAVAKVLNAAAMTYVAATISAVMTLVWLLVRSGLLGGRRD